MNASHKLYRSLFKEKQKCFFRGLASMSQTILSGDKAQKTSLKVIIPVACYSAYHKPTSKFIEKESKRGNARTDIFVNGHNFKQDHDYLREVFSQFGDVMFVDLPKANDSHRSYKHAFIKFYSEESCAKALKARKVKIGPDNYLYIKSRGVPVRERTYEIANLSQNISVQQLHKHFSNYSEVEIINLNFDDSYLKTSLHSAIIVLREKMDDILKFRHQIDGLPLFLSKCAVPEERRKNKGKSILIEGPLKDVTRSKVISHFKSFGRIDGFNHFPGKLFESMAEIQFPSQKIAHNVAKDTNHQIDDSLFKVRALGYFYRDNLYIK